MAKGTETSVRMIGSDPTQGQFITELYCWIATYPDGTEGVMAHGFDGVGMMPLVTSRKHVAEQLRGLAEKIRAASPQKVTVRLVTFTTTEGTRQ